MNIYLESANLDEIRSAASAGLADGVAFSHVTFTADEGAPLLMRHNGTGQVFATPEALSEVLLVPVLTGRGR